MSSEEAKTEEALTIPVTSDIAAAPDTDGLPSTTAPPATNPNARQDFGATTARLSASLRNLGSNIDSRFKLLERAKSVDNRVHVTDATKSTTSWLSNVNERYQIGATAAGAAAAVDEKLKVSETAGKVGEGVRGFDEKHRISVRTMEAVSTGADFLSRKIRGEGPADDEQQNAATATDGTDTAASAPAPASTTTAADAAPTSEPVVAATATLDPTPPKGEEAK